MTQQSKMERVLALYNALPEEEKEQFDFVFNLIFELLLALYEPKNKKGGEHNER